MPWQSERIIPTLFWQLLNQFGRFAVAGVLATVSHMGTLAFLVELFHCNVLVASTTGFSIAVLLSYMLNYRWTFRATRGHRDLLPRYVLVCVSGFTLNTLIMYITVVYLHWWYLAGQFTALFIVPLNNFLLNRYWVFAGDTRHFNMIKTTFGCETDCRE